MSQKVFLEQSAQSLLLMEEIRWQGKILNRICVKESAKTFNQVEESDDELYTVYPIYSGADSDRTKYQMEPQLKQGESCEWTVKNCGNRL